MAQDIKKTILVELGLEKNKFLSDAALTQKQINNLTSEQKKLKEAGQDTGIEYQNNAAQLRLLKQELSTAQRSAANFEKSLKSNTGSLAQQKAELSVLTAAYDVLSDAEKNNTAEGLSLAAAIKKTSDSLKEEEKGLGNNTREVGNYQGAIGGLKDSLSGYAKQNTEIGATYEGLQSSLKAFNDITTQFIGNQKGLTEVLNLHKEALLAGKLAQEAKTVADLAEKEAVLANIAVTEGKITADEAALVITRAQTLSLEAQTTATVASTAATNAASGAFKLFKVALASTGIGAIVILFASLIAYLTSTQSGIDKVTSVTRPLVAIFKSLLGVAQNLGKSLFDAFSNPKELLRDLLSFLEGQVINRVKSIAVIFDGIKNFDLNKVSNGLFQMSTGVENLTGKIQAAGAATNKFLTDAAKKGTEIDRISKEIDKAQLRYNDNQIKVNDALDKQLLISKDTSRTFTEREKAAREIIRLSKENGDEEAKIIQKKIERLKIEQSLNDTGRAGKQELIDLEKELDAAEDRGLDAQLEQTKVISGLKKEQQNLSKEANDKIRADAKALNDELLAIEQESFLKRLSNNDAEVEAVRLKYEKLREEAKKNKLETTKIDNAEAAEQMELANKFAKVESDQDFALSQQRLAQRLALIKNDLEAEFQLKQQILEEQLQQDLANKDLSDTQKIMAEEKFQFDSDGLKTELAEKEILRDKNIALSKEELEQRKLDAAMKGLQIAQEVFAKNTVIGKLAFGLEKVLAIASVKIKTEQALAANRAGEEAQKAWLAAIPIIGPFLAANAKVISIIERGLIRAGGVLSVAKIASSSVQGFRYGGIFQSQGGGIVVGPGTGISDSINAKLSNGEGVMTARAVQMFKPQLSAMNVSGGGKPLMAGGTSFANGGIFDGGTSANFNTPNPINAETIAQAVADGMRGVTIITDIRDVTSAADKQNANITRVTI